MSRRASQLRRQTHKLALVAESARLRNELATELHATWQPMHIAAMAWRLLKLPPIWVLAWRALRRLARRRGSRG